MAVKKERLYRVTVTINKRNSQPQKHVFLVIASKSVDAKAHPEIIKRIELVCARSGVTKPTEVTALLFNPDKPYIVCASVPGSGNVEIFF